MIERMSAFEQRYSEDQREAVVHSYLDRKVRPLKRVLEIAEAGGLKTKDGRQLRPFSFSPQTMRGYITQERRRRAGGARGSALDRPDDVLEGLRKRMISLANDELTHWERKKRGTRDPEQLRQIARLLREVNALPGPKEGRSRAPGERENGQKVDGDTRGGLAASMLAAHRRTTTVSEPLTEDETQAESSNARAHARSEPTTEENADEPGSPQREAGTQRSVPEQTHRVAA